MSEVLSAEQIYFTISVIMLVIMMIVPLALSISKSRKKCYVCNIAVGRHNRVKANDDWYHFECWAKVAKEKLGLT